MKRKALLVGINRYAEVGSDLKGCVNDVKLMEAALTGPYGFPPEGIRTLLDGEATGAALRRELGRLVGDASRGDSLVFHFSGHGSQVPDRDGDEGKDRLDEILCPHDMDWDDPFTDDDLGRYCSALPEGALLTVILDCCHSGTGLREGSPDLPPSVPRHLPRPGSGAVAPLPPRADGTFAAAATRGGAVLVAGCRDDQTSADAPIAGRWHGALTYYLHDAMARGGWRVPLRALVDRTAESLRRNRFSQVPQLEGPHSLLDGILFENRARGVNDGNAAA